MEYGEIVGRKPRTGMMIMMRPRSHVMVEKAVEKARRSDSDDLSATVTPNPSPTLLRPPQSFHPRPSHPRSPYAQPERHPSTNPHPGPESWFGAGFEMSPTSSPARPASRSPGESTDTFDMHSCDRFHQTDIAGTVPHGYWIRKWRSSSHTAQPPLPAQILNQLEKPVHITAQLSTSVTGHESKNPTPSRGDSALLQAEKLHQEEKPRLQLSTVHCEHNDRKLARAAYLAYATAHSSAGVFA